MPWTGARGTGHVLRCLTASTSMSWAGREKPCPLSCHSATASLSSAPTDSLKPVDYKAGYKAGARQHLTRSGRPDVRLRLRMTA